MSAEDLQFLSVGDGSDRRRIALRMRPGEGPPVVWLGGFRSDMLSTKAQALDDWAEAHGRALLRFDYSGHGESEGRFEDGTISRWTQESVAVIRRFAAQDPILVGSSMGGWIALLAARALSQVTPPVRPSALVLIAPAVDFTQALMWEAFPQDIRETIERDGVWMRPSAYAPEPYPVTRALIEDGRRNLLLDGPIRTHCPVHILQGMQDPDVPWRHAMRLVEHLPGDEVIVTLVKDGDHRLSRPQDLDRLVAAVEAAGRAPA